MASLSPAIPSEALTPPSSNVSQQRDVTADIIKGVACLLMVAAHVRFDQAPWLQYVTMAAVLFFTSTGVNFSTILERRRGREKSLALNAIFLFFAGFAGNYVQGTLWQCDVFQSAGMAMLAMLLLRRILPRYWTWLFPLPFLIHAANQHFYWKISAGGVSSFFLTPGLFPLLPWLSFYLFGAHLKQLKRRESAWYLGIVTLALLGVFRLFRPIQFDKWWMSPEYFLIGCTAAAWFFAMVRYWATPARADRMTEIRFWGANSLVFYLLSNFVISVLGLLMPHGVALLLLAFALTALSLRPAIALQKWALRQRPGMVLSGGAITAIAVLGANKLAWPDSFYMQTISSFGLTVAFFTCYPAWKTISKSGFPAFSRLWSVVTPVRNVCLLDSCDKRPSS